MKTYELLTTPRTEDEIRAEQIARLQGVGRIAQSGLGGEGLGASTGQISLSGSGAVDAQCVLRCDAAGSADAATFELSTDGGLTFGAPFTASSSVPVALGSTGLRALFVDGLEGIDSFITGDEWRFSASIPVFDATAWQEESVPRRLIDLDVAAAADEDEAIAAVAKGAYVQDAAEGWLDLHASDVYGIERRAAVFAEGQITLTDTGAGGPHTIAAGTLWAIVGSDPSVRYSNVAGRTLALGGSLNLTFRAEQGGASYNVANGSISELATPIPGVTVSNPSRVGSVTKSRGMAPTVGAALNGTLGGDYSVRVLLTVGGSRGTARFRYSLDGGRNWLPSAATDVLTAATYDLGSSGIRLTFAAGIYIAGDTYTFEASVSWLSQAGANRETDEALAARCRRRWGELAVGAPSALIESVALAASREVTKVYSIASTTVPGQINVWLAGESGAVPAGAIAAVEAALAPLIPLCCSLLVQSATSKTIALTGTVYTRGAPATAQSTALAALAAYQAATPIGGNLIGGSGIVSRDVVIGCLTGGLNASRIVDLDLTTPAGDTTLASSEVPVFDAAGLSWVEA